MENKGTLLIVDDEPRNLKILRKRLQSNYDIHEAGSGEEALELLEHIPPPEVIILDIMMPGIDGYEVTKKIRESARWPHTKIILVSGKAMIDEKMSGYQAGADDYVTKPINGDEIKAKVKVFAELSLLEQKITTKIQDLSKLMDLKDQQLQKSERLASVGLHIAEIVHNLRNPLAFIRLAVELAEDTKECSHLKKAIEGLDRIDHIIGQILEKSREDILSELQTIESDEFIKKELSMQALITKQNITVDLDLKGGPIEVIQSHLSQVFDNLIANSVYALKNVKNPIIRIQSLVQDHRIDIYISDNGPGIPKESLGKIFASQFTTKGEDGTGIGLSYCQRVIESFHGTIKALPSDTGALFYISLPLKSRNKSAA